ncbi:MAG: MOSC domain-containing protein [Mycobacteriaceae bacterium]
MPRIARISMTPVKGTALGHPEGVALGRNGVEHNRRFHLIDDMGHLVNGKQCGPLVGLQCSYDGATLTVDFPGGATLSETVTLSGERVQTNFYGRRSVPGALVGGGFAEAISDHTGRALRLVRVDAAESGVDVAPLTLISTATLDNLRSTVQAPQEYWADRFRMLFELDGLAPYEEESWAGLQVRVGDVVLAVQRLVPRCVVTKQNPRTGERDFNVLDALQQERNGLLLGMYATVVHPGTVRRGEAVSV